MKKKFIIPMILSLVLVFSFVSITQADTTNGKSAIPIMTSDTAPSGKATSSEAYLPAWMAFDGIKYYSTTNSNYAAWGTPKTSGWLAYEFPTKIVISKYVIYYGTHAANGYINGVNPKQWTFEGSNDGIDWTVLDTQNNVTTWKDGEEKEYTFNNDTAFKRYRINISANNGSTNNTVNLTIHELGMFEKISTTPEPTLTPEPIITPEPTAVPTLEPTPTVTPSPTPEQPYGDRAILVITMSNGLEKEFDLSMSEVNAFLKWYDSASGSTKYGINKHENNKGPFSKRTDYVIFDKILTFEVNEYTAVN